MKKPDPEDLAREYFEKAYQYQVQGKLKHAERCYRRSIELHPTAESHTFLGWTYSFTGKYEDAIAECKRAIEVDPTFGNPYNDIGAYYVELGRPREAIEWLKKAMTAERYEPRHYPHFNLGRVFESIGHWPEAMDEYRKAIDLYPDYTIASQALSNLQARLN